MSMQWKRRGSILGVVLVLLFEPQRHGDSREKTSYSLDTDPTDFSNFKDTQCIFEAWNECGCVESLFLC